MPEIFTQVYMAFGSERLFDHYFNSAHTLKLLAYICLLMGILIDLSLPNTRSSTAKELQQPSNASQDDPPPTRKF